MAFIPAYAAGAQNHYLHSPISPRIIIRFKTRCFRGQCLLDGTGFRIDANLLIIESIHAVSHGGAGHWLTRGRAYAQAVGKNVANPNEEIVAELIRREVSI